MERITRSRSSDESAIGAVAADVFADNTQAWSGDHCMDPAHVPGVFLSNRPGARAGSALGTVVDLQAGQALGG